MLSTKLKKKDQNLTFLSNFSLTYGIGNKRLEKISKNLGLNYRFLKLHTKKKINLRIETFFRRYLYTFHLRRKKKKSMDFLWLIRSYKGFRHKFGLPSRGQRTKTNARTKKKVKFF